MTDVDGLRKKADSTINEDSGVSLMNQSQALEMILLQCARDPSDCHGKHRQMRWDIDK